MVDSHFHLDLIFKLGNIIDEKVQFSIIENISTKLKYSINISDDINEILNFRNNMLFNNIYSCYALYPDRANENLSNLESTINELINKKLIVAIGETGIDLYHKNYPDLKSQISLFMRQFEIAYNNKLPVIVHSRNAFLETMEVIKRFNHYEKVIIHCFGYGPYEVEKFLEENCYISFAGNILYKNSDKLREALKMVPLDKLLLETDSPFLSMDRKSINFPYYIENNYKFISDYLNINFTDLEKSIENNFEKLFLK